MPTNHVQSIIPATSVASGSSVSAVVGNRSASQAYLVVKISSITGGANVDVTAELVSALGNTSGYLVGNTITANGTYWYGLGCDIELGGWAEPEAIGALSAEFEVTVAVSVGGSATIQAEVQFLTHDTASGG